MKTATALIMGGLAMLVRIGAYLGPDVEISYAVQLEMLVAVLLLLLGGVGDWKPIRYSDAPKPLWDTGNSRSDLRVFSHRGQAMQTLRESLPPPPSS
mmetsp:Transcript_55586/g.121756  ORF Transcript_55586/g.121756 Transcript_55586/m.121756 type:complete len:97 (+) Transcript_55586:53-343(+)